MKCPVDGTALLITERSGVEIDYCPQCRGVWLDRGELEKLMAEQQAILDECGTALSSSSIYETARAADLKKTLASQAATQVALAETEAEWLAKNDALEALTA